MCCSHLGCLGTSSAGGFDEQVEARVATLKELAANLAQESNKEFELQRIEQRCPHPTP